MTSRSGAVLELDRIRRVFTRRGGIREATLHVARGEVVAVVGPNGCGKSTLLRVAAGILRPDAGTVWRAPGSRLGWSEEEPRLQPDHTVADYLATFAAIRGIPVQAVPALCEQWGVGDLQVRCAALSRGQRRRVALSRAFLGSSRILLLDEPLSGLDREWRDHLWDSILGATRKSRATVLTMHTLEEAEMIPRTVVVWGGRVIFDGPTTAAAQGTEGLAVVTLRMEEPSSWEALEASQREGRLVAWRALDDGVEVVIPTDGTAPLLDLLSARRVVCEPVGTELPFLDQVSHAA